MSRRALALVPVLLGVAWSLGGAAPLDGAVARESGRVIRLAAGTITEDMTWDARTVWRLAGPLHVTDGATLTIEAGARIEAERGARILVDRTSRIVAVGTLYEPVVFSCVEGTPAFAGCWGGLILQGNAPINTGSAVSPAARGVGAAGCRQLTDPSTGTPFGGCDAADSSGVLRYVRIEYAEFTGLALAGVGSGTRIDHVQLNRGLSTGVGIHGGTVDLSRLVFTSNGGAGLHWTGGWTGRAQFLLMHLDLTNGLGGLSGLVGENGPAGAIDALPRSAPVISNVSIFAVPSATPGVAASAVKLTKGTHATVKNLIAYRAPTGVSLDSDVAARIASGAIGVSHSVFAASGTTASSSVAATWLTDPAQSNQVVSDLGAAAALIRGVDDFVLLDGRSEVTLAGDVPPAGGFFEPSATWIGAVPPVSASPVQVLPWHAGWIAPAPVPSATPAGTLRGVVASAQVGALAATVSASGVAPVNTDLSGRFTLALPAGPNAIGVSGLTGTCTLPSGLSVDVPSGRSVDVPFLALCKDAVDAYYELSAGLAHTCGIRADAITRCVGDNQYGQLGDGSVTSVLVTPARVAGRDDFAHIGAGLFHSCGLTPFGEARCWGRGANGQVGDGGTGSSLIRREPVAVVGGHVFLQLAVGGYQTCGLDHDRRAWCWGENLGDGTNGYGGTPRAVVGGHQFQQLVAGLAHTCGLDLAGATWCWGGNGVGQLGDGTTTRRDAPVAVAGGHQFASITAGREHNCGLRADGAAFCWGYSVYGQTGDGGNNLVHFTPFAVVGGITFAALEAGTYHTCGVSQSGAAFCWGANYAGQIGDGTTDDRNAPTVVAPGTTFRQLTAGGEHSCGRSTSGQVLCWGSNAQGQFGDGTTTSSALPVVVPLP